MMYPGLAGMITMLLIIIVLAGKHIKYVKDTKFVLDKNDALVKRNNFLGGVLPEKTARLERSYREKIEQTIRQINQNVSEVQTRIISQAMSGQSAKDLQSHMKTLIETTYSRMSQEFIGSLSDDTDKLLRNLNENLCERVWDSVQQMKVQFDESPYILPHDAVIAYTKGNRTIVVVEQKPQVRTMGFSPELVGHHSRSEAVSTSTQAYRFTLSFPYVYFFIVFDGASFSYYELFFRNKPLTSVREHVYTPPLPNIHRDKKNYQPVCMGVGFIKDVRAENTIVRQCKEVVSEFWQRPFNDHLGGGISQSIDKRLKNYRIWQEETEKDAMFILTVKWGKGKTTKSVLDNMFAKRKMTHSSDNIDKKIRLMLESGVKDITKTLKDAIDTAKKNNTLRAGNLDPIVKEKLETVVVDHTKKVFEHCTKE